MSRLRSFFSSRIKHIVGDQRGFTMIAVMTGMTVISMFSLGAYAAALGDISVGRKDQDHKRALEAAKAGIEWYSYHLYKDSNYWTYCDAAPAVTPGISLQGANRPAGAWRTLPNSEEQFQVELMTADGNAMTQAQCLADPGGKMLDGGVLRIRVTGRSRGKTRQIVGTFRRNTFLDYLWYTNWETSPPTAQTDPTWAATNCDQKRSLRRAASGGNCSEIQFQSSDNVGGPMHTEDDSFLVCGSPTFGRIAADNIEVALATSAGNAYVSDTGGCSKSPNLQGTTIAPAKSLDLPPNNQDLADAATYTLTGQSCVTFNGDGTATLRQNMSWGAPPTPPATPPNVNTIDCTTGGNVPGTVQTVTLGSNTVIYAQNAVGGCPAAYSKVQRYTTQNKGCGDIAVRGTYTTNVTVGAADDIVAVGNLRQGTGNPMMGLVANNYVRVYHPAYNNAATPACQAGGVADTSQVNFIDGAILALQGSFIADNWSCGAGLGNLNLKGNMAQYWRGPVGLVGGSGYTKAYTYDDRLKYRQPPSYLDPQQAAWHVLRQSEQSPVK
jgi:type II secretory pathway pseudopilin PulG